MADTPLRLGASGGSERHSERGPAEVPAWDLPTRLFKWSLVLLVLNAWLTQQLGDAGIQWHIYNGYSVLVLLVFRLLWGVVGSSTARFGAWLAWPWTALRYGHDILRGRARPYLGHNPLGAQMIVALLLTVGAQAVTGLFTVDNNGVYGGPFSNLDFGDPSAIQRLFSRWHHWAFNLLLAFIIVHVAVNLFYQFAKRDPVVAAMITGRKPVEPFADQPAMRPAPYAPVRAILCLAVAIVIVFGGIRLFGGAIV